MDLSEHTRFVMPALQQHLQRGLASFGVPEPMSLTAKDRPYKDGMKLSQALNILEEFKNNGHIDPDLYAVFVQSEVYRQYAAAFLEAQQIDC